MHSKVLLALVLLLISIVVSSQARAMPPNVFYPEGKNPYENIKPWCAYLKEKIRAGEGYSAFDKLRVRKLITCAFVLGQKGGIVNLKVIRSSGNVDLDKAALDIVRLAAPLKIPPNNLPYEERVAVEFVPRLSASDPASLGVFIIDRNWGMARFE